MKNEKSYTELMKSKAQEKRVSRESFMVNMYVQMVIDEAIFLFQKQRFLEKIDAAIDANNKVLFQSLCAEYQAFVHQWEK